MKKLVLFVLVLVFTDFKTEVDAETTDQIIGFLNDSETKKLRNNRSEER